MIRRLSREGVRLHLFALWVLTVLGAGSTNASELTGAAWWIQQEAIDPAFVTEYEQSSREFFKAVSSSVGSEIYALRGKNSVYTYLATGPAAALATLQQLGRGRAQGLMQRGLIVPNSRRDWAVVEWPSLSQPPSSKPEDVVFYRLSFHYQVASDQDCARRGLQVVGDLSRELNSGFSAFRASPESGLTFYVVGEGARSRDGFIALADLQRSINDSGEAEDNQGDSSTMVVVEGVVYPELSFPGDRTLADAMWSSINAQPRTPAASARQRRRARSQDRAADSQPVDDDSSLSTAKETSAAVSTKDKFQPETGRQEGAGIVPREPFPLPSQAEPKRSEQASQPRGVVPLEPLPHEPGPDEPDPDWLDPDQPDPDKIQSSETPREEEGSKLPGPGLSLDDIELTLQAWALAWSEQRVDHYLGFYSDRFQPTEDRDLEEWVAWRRVRVSSPSKIEVSLDSLAVKSEASETVQAEFVQTYASNSYRDTVRKRLELVYENGAWRIIDERVIPGEDN